MTAPTPVIGSRIVRGSSPAPKWTFSKVCLLLLTLLAAPFVAVYELFTGGFRSTSTGNGSGAMGMLLIALTGILGLVVWAAIIGIGLFLWFMVSHS